MFWRGTRLKHSLNGFSSYSLFLSSPSQKKQTASLTLTFSHSTVFTYQLPADTLPLVTAGAPQKGTNNNNSEGSSVSGDAP